MHLIEGPKSSREVRIAPNRAVRLNQDQATMKQPLTVAVVGAGLAGSTAAQLMADRGLQVDLYDKARGVGGRTATRRAAGGTLSFDHGAQYFTARDLRFRRQVDAWVQQGVVARWNPRLAVLEDGQSRLKESQTDRFVGRPKMSAMANQLCESLTVQCGVRVGEVYRRKGSWRVFDDTGDELGGYDALVLTAPAPQTAQLLAGVATALLEQVESVFMEPTWAVMLGFDQPLPLDFDAAFVNQGPLSWIARNSAKPGRNEPECWVIHSSHDWASERLENSGDAVGEALLAAFEHATGLSPAEHQPTFRSAHRWRYAAARQPLEQGALFDAQLKLAIAGDWVAGSRVEGAFLSGCAAADWLTGSSDDVS
jgi:predicted NAD/FAD-dependent oxidoreductase